MDGLTDEARKQMREHYFGQLKDFGLQNDPYQALREAVSAIAKHADEIEHLVDKFVDLRKTTAEMESNKVRSREITSTDLEQVMNLFSTVLAKVKSFNETEESSVCRI